MLNAWFAMTMLAIESSEVMALRLAKFAHGGSSALDEAELMVTEKIGAGSEAFASLLGGANSLAVINRYRDVVAANHRRLSFGNEMDPPHGLPETIGFRANRSG